MEISDLNLVLLSIAGVFAFSTIMGVLLQKLGVVTSEKQVKHTKKAASTKKGSKKAKSSVK